MASAAGSSSDSQPADVDMLDNDIAKTTSLEQMAVEAPGRKPLQHVYLWARTVQPRDPAALRAYIPVTDTIATQAKYVVGCRMWDGHLTPRVIKAGSIYFYKEFGRSWRAHRLPPKTLERRP